MQHRLYIGCQPSLLCRTQRAAGAVLQQEPQSQRIVCRSRRAVQSSARHGSSTRPAEGRGW